MAVLLLINLSHQFWTDNFFKVFSGYSVKKHNFQLDWNVVFMQKAKWNWNHIEIYMHLIYIKHNLITWGGMIMNVNSRGMIMNVNSRGMIMNVNSRGMIMHVSSFNFILIFTINVSTPYNLHVISVFISPITQFLN